MVTFRDLTSSLQQLGIARSQPVISHASLSAFGDVRGGAPTVIGALLTVFPRIMMPTFTYKTMIIPEVGPPGNSLNYGSGKDANQMAEFFDPDMPADKLMGVIAETLRQHPKAHRSSHPILSFAGVNLDEALAAQSIEEPLAPIQVLTEEGGWVLLIGVDHTVNTSIHYAEKLAKRKQFVRWALTPTGIRECPGFPGCSDGFDALKPHLEEITHQKQIGEALVQAVPLLQMITAIRHLIEEDPASLLCARSDCQRCHENRP